MTQRPMSRERSKMPTLLKERSNSPIGDGK
jgi:hypothetical protein